MKTVIEEEKPILVVPEPDSFEAAVDIWKYGLRIYNFLVENPNVFSLEEIRKWAQELRRVYFDFCDKHGLKKSWSRMECFFASLNELIPSLDLDFPTLDKMI